MLTSEELAQLVKIDDALLYHEFLALAGFALFDQMPKLVLQHSFAYEDIKIVKERFLRIYNALASANTEVSE